MNNNEYNLLSPFLIPLQYHVAFEGQNKKHFRETDKAIVITDIVCCVTPTLNAENEIKRPPQLNCIDME